MKTLSWPSIGWYSLFGIFVFYQQLHAKRFRGASQAFGLLLSLSAFVGYITGIAYLIYYGWAVVWWAPIIIFFIGLLAVIPGVLVERFIGAMALSLGAFIGWPICAYFMFTHIPTG